MDNWLTDDDEDPWKWNWTELCGSHGGIKPLNPITQDLDVCFQQLCLQIPVLVCIAIISAYHCGKRNTYSIHRFRSSYVINLRIIITISFVILPILKAYIILTNTDLAPPKSVSFSNNSIQKYMETSTKKPDNSSILNQIQEEWNHSIGYAKSIFSSQNSVQNYIESSAISNIQKNNPVLTVAKYQVTSAKPIDYLVAGTEGLTWIVHLCFILSLRRGRDFNPRGPVSIRALIFLLIVISTLLLRSHIKHNPQDDVLPNLSLGFSISVVTLLILYAMTLILNPSDRLGKTSS